MSKKYMRLSMLLIAWIMGVAAYAQHEHVYHNGICTVDGCSRSVDGYYETPEQAADGYYELKNAGHVEWLSLRVEQGKIDDYARLMNDIDFEGIENLHHPIGPDNGKKYNGTFDGQGHRIMNMIINRPDAERQGFFGDLRGNPNGAHGEATVIKNLIIDKSCSILGKHKVAGLVASGQNNDKEIYILNCVNEASVTAMNNNVGGIVGGSDSNHPKWQIINCVNAGRIESLKADGPEAAAIATWLGDNAGTRVENCLNVGEIVGMDINGRNLYRHSGSLTAKNNYDFSEMMEGLQGFDHDMEPEALGSGELCYHMNGDQLEIVWHQRIGTDAYPIPLFIEGGQVYAQGTLNCDGTPASTTFTNSPSTPIRPDHEFEGDDYHCINCGAVDPNYCEQDEEGWYLVGTPKQMNWFAELVNTQNEQYRAMKVKLTADLDYDELDDEIQFVGRNATPYVGTFDGQFHKVSNYVVESSENAVGFIGYINGGATIKNLVLDNTCSITGQNGVGLVAFCANPGDVLLENLGNEADITSQTGGAGGVLGCNTGSKAKIYMRNCYNTGNVTGLSVNENGLLSAWLGSNGAVVENCWATGVLTGAQGPEKWLARHDNATFRNCYAIEGTQGIIIDELDVETGALCFKLNGDQSNITWYQNIDEGETDYNPTFIPTHAVVYANAKKNCDGSFDPEDVVYGNTDSSVIPPHTYVDGFCKVCGHEDEEYPFIAAFPNADHNENGGYTKEDSEGSSILGREYNVMENWDARKFTVYQELTNLEPGTYKVRVQGYSRISAWEEKANDEYIYDQTDGTPDASLYLLHHNSQYYVEKDGKRIANRFMDITDGKQPQKMSEGAENMFNDESYYIPNSRRAAEQYFLKGNYWNKPLYFTVDSKDDVVKVGVHNAMFIHGNWTVWDTWRLEKVSDDATAAIRTQQIDALQDLTELQAQKSLEEAYAKASADIKTVSTLEDAIALADVLSRTPEQIRLSHLAYLKYVEAVQAVLSDMEGKELNGAYAELLKSYMEDNEGASEGLPNGTYDYIMQNRPLSIEELTDEITFIQQLYMSAVKSSIAAGADLTALIVNPGFDQDNNWTGWSKEEYRSGDNSSLNCNTGYTDIYPIAGSYHKAFAVWQDLEEGLPNGIYELTAPAFHRPGGEGFDGGVIEDLSTAELYINDFYTPVLNVWEGEVSYADAINGVNCRFDAVDDPSVPHNGQDTGSQCFDTGTGYIPGSGRQCLSFIFNGGRYVNKAYAIVKDGKLRIGIRNTGKPWYNGQETMWGRFQLTYVGSQSADAQNAMIENAEKRIKKLTYAHTMGTQDGNLFFMSSSHLNTLNDLLATAKSQSGEAQLEALCNLNDAFNATYKSFDIYSKLEELMLYCEKQSGALWETNPDLADLFDQAFAELEEILYEGSLTDEEAEEYYNSFMLREDLGGGYYVQGDLLDANGANIAYSDTCRTYKMTKLPNGKYYAEGVKVQNRANKPNANGRAGMFISCMGVNYKVDNGIRRYVTPAHTDYRLTKGAGNDLQMTGGTFNVTFDPETCIASAVPTEYNWADRVFVVGSVANGEGEIQTDPNAATRVRWLNNEDCALAHQGDGVYASAIDFFEDPAHPGYLAFTIFTCRATDGKPEFSYKATRSNWNEGRVGTDGNSNTIIEEATEYDDLIRGEDRQWWLAWDNATQKQTYTVVYDMNRNTMKITKGDHMDAIDAIQNGEMEIEGIYTIDGMRVMKVQRGVNIVNGKKVLVK